MRSTPEITFHRQEVVSETVLHTTAETNIIKNVPLIHMTNNVLCDELRESLVTMLI